jgi:hypothetical protein
MGFFIGVQRQTNLMKPLAALDVSAALARR